MVNIKIPDITQTAAADVELAGPLDAVAPVMDTVSTITGVTDAVTFGVPILGGIGAALNWLGNKNWLPGGKAVGSTLQKPARFFERESTLGLTKPEHIAETNAKIAEANRKLPAGAKPMEPFKPTLGNDLWHGSMVVGAGVETFQVARSFFQKQKILKIIRADMAADKAARHAGRSTGEVGSLIEAGNHISLEHGLRGLLTIGSFLFLLRGARRGNVSNWAFFAPMFANMGIDAFMGENELINGYVPLREAYKHGQIAQKDYSEFLFAVSKELNSRGNLAKPAAAKLAEYYAAEKASPAHILNDMSDGTFKKLLADAVAAVDAQPSAAAPRAGQIMMQDRLNGAPLARPVIGEHTGKLHHKAVEQGVIPTLHRT